MRMKNVRVMAFVLRRIEMAGQPLRKYHLSDMPALPYPQLSFASFLALPLRPLRQRL
jgi:hypothetical protein